MTVLVGIAAANRPNNLLVWVFGAMLAGVLISGLVSGGMLMGVRAVRIDPRRGAIGEPLVIRYAITNRGRLWPAFNLHVAELPAATSRRRAIDGERAAPWQRAMAPAEGWVMHVGAGETVHGELVLFPSRRGRVLFDRFRVWTTFPFGFLRKSVTFRQRSETLVFPRVFALRADLLDAIARGGIGGFRLSDRSGDGEDYFGVREYRPGDSIRQIAWKRVASGQGLVSIERSRASPPRLRVVVNLRLSTEALRGESEGADPRELEENAIALAASFVQQAEQSGYEVGLTVLGVATERLPLRRGHWHVEKLMAALAAIDLEEPRDAHATVAEVDRDRAQLVVIHPGRAAPSSAPAGAWHFRASELDDLIAAPGGTDIDGSGDRPQAAPKREAVGA